MRSTRLAAVTLAGVLTLGAAATSVAAPAKSSTVKPTCAIAVTEQIPAGGVTINTGDTHGASLGTVTCGKLLGSGLAWMSFTVPASGNLVGGFKQYYATGSMHGKYVLVPTDSNSPQPSTFSAASYAGTLTVDGGTGAYHNAKGKGTITCRTPDSIHFSCTEHLKLARL